MVRDALNADEQIGGDAAYPVPLVVDLDGTLTAVDSLHEALVLAVARDPWRLLAVPGWLKRGKAGFKRKIAEAALSPADLLPLRADVLAHIETARAEGRSVFLISAADQAQVDAVAEETGLFDDAVGSDGVHNLGGAAKAAYLTDRFGARGFDYIGDAETDRAVWAEARRAITAGADARIRRLAEAAGAEETLHLAPPPGRAARLAAHLKAMRPHQWLKNLLVFLPALAAHAPGALPVSALAFLAFSLAASAIYLINDMLDLDADRRHPRKRTRPFAAGTIPVAHGVLQAGGLILGALILGGLVGWGFLGILLGYVALTTAYSITLKRRQMIDIWTLGALYTIRIVAGGAATGLALSEWLLAFSMFLFLALAAIKRQSELADLVARGLEQTEGRGYRVADLPVLMGVALAAGYCSVLVLALYISSDAVAALYSRPEFLWLVCALLLYWISRAVMISWRGEMDDDPIVFAIKDKVSLGVGAAAAVLAVLGALA